MSAIAGLMGSSQCDAEVIEQSWREPERFSVIFDRYFSEIHRYLAWRAGQDAADDLAADVFLAAFAQRTRYDLARGCARAWLYGIATNLAGSHRRREGRYFRALARAGGRAVWHGDDDRVTDRVSASAMRPALAAALTRLEPGDRDVLLLVALAGLGYPEVAQALGIPYGTVCSRLNRARRLVRAALGGNNPTSEHEE